MDILEILAPRLAGLAAYGATVLVVAACLGRSTETGDDEL